jgi:hypothetical protein
VKISATENIIHMIELMYSVIERFKIPKEAAVAYFLEVTKKNTVNPHDSRCPDRNLNR